MAFAAKVPNVNNQRYRAHRPHPGIQSVSITTKTINAVKYHLANMPGHGASGQAGPMATFRIVRHPAIWDSSTGFMFGQA